MCGVLTKVAEFTRYTKKKWAVWYECRAMEVKMRKYFTTDRPVSWERSSILEAEHILRSDCEEEIGDLE